MVLTAARGEKEKKNHHCFHFVVISLNIRGTKLFVTSPQSPYVGYIFY